MNYFTTPVFLNRREAGRKLAESLELYRKQNPIILAMPRGGVVVAFEIAQALQAPLDVVVVRKLGAPGQPEYAIGAIAPGDIVVFNPDMQSYFSESDPKLQEIIESEKREMQRRITLYCYDGKQMDISNKVVIIVDDGIATGQSALAAIRSVRKQNPSKIIFASPVGAADSVAMLTREVDTMICLIASEHFYAVGQWYSNFDQTEDNEVIALLKQNRESLQK